MAAAGVITSRSGRLRDMAFSGMPSARYPVMIQMPVPIHDSGQKEKRAAFCSKIDVMSAYIVMANKLDIRRTTGNTLC